MKASEATSYPINYSPSTANSYPIIYNQNVNYFASRPNGAPGSVYPPPMIPNFMNSAYMTNQAPRMAESQNKAMFNQAPNSQAAVPGGFFYNVAKNVANNNLNQPNQCNMGNNNALLARQSSGGERDSSSQISEPIKHMQMNHQFFYNNINQNMNNNSSQPNQGNMGNNNALLARKNSVGERDSSSQGSESIKLTSQVPVSRKFFYNNMNTNITNNAQANQDSMGNNAASLARQSSVNERESSTQASESAKTSSQVSINNKFPSKNMNQNMTSNMSQANQNNLCDKQLTLTAKSAMRSHDQKETSKSPETIQAMLCDSEISEVKVDCEEIEEEYQLEHSRYKASSKTWTEKHDEKLLKLRLECQGDWKKIAQRFADKSITPLLLKNRYKELISPFLKKNTKSYVPEGVKAPQIMKNKHNGLFKKDSGVDFPPIENRESKGSIGLIEDMQNNVQSRNDVGIDSFKKRGIFPEQNDHLLHFQSSIQGNLNNDNQAGCVLCNLESPQFILLKEENEMLKRLYFNAKNELNDLRTRINNHNGKPSK